MKGHWPIGHRHHRNMGTSIHPGRQRARVLQSVNSAQASATTGGHHILVSSMSDGTAAPVIQYGKTASADPSGKWPTGSKSQPVKHVTATARAGATKRNSSRAAIPKDANIASIIFRSLLDLSWRSNIGHQLEHA